jgi:hypothetical protein
MSGPPPQDLMAWPKGKLADEVRRLRAIMQEHAERRGGDPLALSSPHSPMVDVAGDHNALGGVLLDARSAVLLDAVEVSLVDTKREGEEPLIAFLVLSGRVNYSEDRVHHAYAMPADGAAGLVDELIALANRSLAHSETYAYGVQFTRDLARRRREQAT